MRDDTAITASETHSLPASFGRDICYRGLCIRRRDVVGVHKAHTVFLFHDVIHYSAVYNVRITSTYGHRYGCATSHVRGNEFDKKSRMCLCPEYHFGYTDPRSRCMATTTYTPLTEQFRRSEMITNHHNGDRRRATVGVQQEQNGAVSQATGFCTSTCFYVLYLD